MVLPSGDVLDDGSVEPEAEDPVPAPELVDDDQPVIVEDPAPPADRRRVAYVALAVLILVGAGVLRAIALPSALPYTAYIDEGYVLRPAAHMVAERTWDPAWYGYPSLLIELTAATTGAYDLVGDDVRLGARETDATLDYNVVAPTSLIVSARLVVWAAGVGTVLVSMLLATRLLGRRAGLVAGAIVAVVPALVVRSSIVIVDTPATFLVLASMLAASAIGRVRRPLVPVVAAGALAGLAFTAKYPSAAVIVVALVMIASTSSYSLKRKAGLAALAGAAAAVAAVIAMPALVLRTRDVAQAIQDQAAVYARKTTDTNYLQEVIGPLEVGWWLLLPALVGLGVLAWRRRSRWLTIGWLAFVAVFALAVTRSAYQPFRNVLPLVPFLAIAAAATIVEGARLIATGLSGGARRRARPIAIGIAAVAALVLMAALVDGGVRPYLENQAQITDTRTQAVDWLVAEVQPGQRVFIASELAVATSDLRRIPGEVVVGPTTNGAPPIDPDYDYVVTGVHKGLTEAPPPPPGLLVAGFGLVKSQPREGLWRGTSQIIEIREIPDPATPSS